VRWSDSWVRCTTDDLSVGSEPKNCQWRLSARSGRSENKASRWAFQQLRKNYGAIPVLHGIDLAIADGQFVSLVGASGRGKSTLLRMIAGLESATSGAITLNGRVINDVSAKDRDIAMVFQNYALYPHMTDAQNMGLSLQLRKDSPELVKQAVQETAAMLGLSSYLDRYPKALSGGQRQRVATGRAIVRHPQVFLFDEPLSNLDAKLRVQMRIEIRTLQRRLGTTAIYVIHDQMEAMTLSDHQQPLVKYLAFVGCHTVLRSANRKYPDRFIMEGDDFDIWGVVTHSIRGLWRN